MSEDCPELQKRDVITTSKSPHSLWNEATVLKTPGPFSTFVYVLVPATLRIDDIDSVTRNGVQIWPAPEPSVRDMLGNLLAKHLPYPRSAFWAVVTEMLEDFTIERKTD